MEKKFARLEAARSTDVTSLQAELDSLKVGAREQLNERDAKINELVEELGNTQALLSDKSNELDQVGVLSPTITSLVTSFIFQDQPSKSAGQRKASWLSDKTSDRCSI